MTKEERKETQIILYKRKVVVKFIMYLLVVSVFSLAAVFACIFGMYHLWNYFCPENDTLEFLALYVIFGTYINYTIYIIASANINKYIDRSRIRMKIWIRRIERYFNSFEK